MTKGRGKLIVLEGAEGVGKTTQLRRLAETLTARGISHLGVREPGGTAIGNQIRNLLLEPGPGFSARTEALLFMASRAELVETDIRPALARGEVVLADRFFLSTYAYQIAGRGLSEVEVTAANRFATGGLVPDLTILLRLSVAAALARTDSRGARDRIESASDDFHHRVAEAFDRFAEPAWQRNHPESGPVVAIDAAGSVDEVAAGVLGTLEQTWPETFRPAVGSHS
ncbi:MAG TPA: dTMP kinase [Gemmatimonadaceae bacterium]|jgi:dTMP kinase|nr:dTMP kinase [Gemmatimonadaceae bacterium]